MTIQCWFKCKTCELFKWASLFVESKDVSTETSVTPRKNNRKFFQFLGHTDFTMVIFENFLGFSLVGKGGSREDVRWSTVQAG